MSERALTTRILHAIRDRGHWAMKVVGHGMQGGGYPDIIACVRGRLVGIEVKVGKNKLTKLQELRAHQIGASGGYFFVARDLEDILIEIDKISARHS